MSYSKIEYYENGCLKSIEVRGWLISVSANVDDFKQKKDK